MKVPNSLNTDFFTKVVKNGYNLVDFTIGDVKVEIGTSAGDNYCSTIYRVFLDVIDSQQNVEKIQFLIKHELNNETSGELLDKMEVFGKEVDMFKNIVPRLSKITGGVQFAARFYYTLSEPKSKLIVLQDLKELNFRMADRQNALDYEHCCITLDKLGQMHAASMVLAKENPSLMDKYNFGIYHGSVGTTGFIEQLLGANFPTLCDAVRNWDGFEKISEKLDKMKDNFWAIVYEAASDKND
uniref:Putative ecdysteroid kinase n=2 Tax=Lutzomyia longipalpis TaxID=7200 RepID=A0A1B0CBC2_LUTLO